MSDTVRLSTFPSCESEALAYLYIQQHISAEMTIDEISKLYYSVEKEFSQKLKDLRKADRAARTIPGLY